MVDLAFRYGSFSYFLPIYMWMQESFPPSWITKSHWSLKLMRSRQQWSSNWRKSFAWGLLLVTATWRISRFSRMFKCPWTSLFLCWRKIGKMWVLISLNFVETFWHCLLFLYLFNVCWCKSGQVPAPKEYHGHTSPPLLSEFYITTF